MKTILITGGDGYLGRRLARIFLSHEDSTVLLWIRAANQEEFKSKGKRLCQELCETNGRLRLFYGDLREEEPFNTIDPQNINLIVHTAAVTRFNVDQETAQAINVDGTRKLLDFAQRCSGLKRLMFVSTIYASGLQEGEISEQTLSGTHGFSNHYEWSKWSAEQCIANEYPELPWMIARVATVIADSIDGLVAQQNAFHNTLKLIYYGLLSILPGRADTPLYFVTADFVSDAISVLMEHAETAKIVHVAHTRKESLTLGALVDTIFEIFEQEPDFKKRRILKPLYSDRESFKLLVDAVQQFGGGVVNQAVSSVAPFSQQLYLNKDVQNSNLQSALKGYSAPDPVRLIQNTCRYLVSSRWGKK